MKYRRNNRGSIILDGNDGNQFTITKREREELNTLVKRANQRRVDVAHRYYDGLVDSEMMVGKDYDGYMELLESKGFITEKYSTSLSQFQSKDDVKEMLKELRQVTKRGYGQNRIDDVRYRMIEQIRENYNGQGKELEERIKSMSRSELLGLYLLSDKEIIQSIFYPTEDIVESKASETNAYIDTLLNGSTDNKLSKKEYQKGFNAFRQRKRRNRDKWAQRSKAKRDSARSQLRGKR